MRFRNFGSAVDEYVDEMWVSGRFNSKRTEHSYRRALQIHAQDVLAGDPYQATRDDVRKTLRRYRHPNTQRRNRSMLVSFYDWMVEYGHRPDNPGRQTRSPRARKPEIYKMTLAESKRFLEAAQGYREQVVAYLGICAGLRREELRLLQGRHFARDGWVWVSPDIAKGGKGRWVPVIADLEPVVAVIRERCGMEDFILPPQQFSDPGRNREPIDQQKPGDGKTVWRICKRIGVRAGIPAPVHPHMMRHAFADHIARFAGLRSAQSMLGHADVSTTQGYLDETTLDDLKNAVEGLTFGVEIPTVENGLESQQWRRWESNPRTSPTGIDGWVAEVVTFAQERGAFYREALA